MESLGVGGEHRRRSVVGGGWRRRGGEGDRALFLLGSGRVGLGEGRTGGAKIAVARSMARAVAHEATRRVSAHRGTVVASEAHKAATPGSCLEFLQRESHSPASTAALSP